MRSLFVFGLGFVCALTLACTTDGSGLELDNVAGQDGGANDTGGTGNVTPPSSGGMGGSAGGGGSAGSAGSGGSAGSAGNGGAGGSAGAPATGGVGGSAGAGGGSGGSAGGGAGGSAGGSGGAGGNAGTGGSALPPIAIVQTSSTMTSTEGVPTLTLQTAPHAGNAIIVGVSCLSSYMRDCVIGEEGVTDNRGNGYTRIAQGEALLSSAQGARGYIFIAENIETSNGPFVISVNPDGTPNGGDVTQTVVWGAVEVSGLAAPPSRDAWGVSLTGDSGAMSTTTTTDLPTVQPNTLAVAVLTMRSNDTNMLITPQNAWTSHHIQQNGAAGPPGHSMVSRVLTQTGIVTHEWTHDPPTRGVAAIIATFKGARP